MTTFYSVCAILGGTVLVCQFVLTITGLGHADDVDGGHDFDAGHDVHHGPHDAGHDGQNSHHGSNWFFGVISFRTITAALAFFGLTGLATTAGKSLDDRAALAISIGAGLASMFFVHWMMRSLALLRAEGTVRVQEAVGAKGSVYVKIPGRNAGPGKVQISLQGRTVELTATTEHEMLPTGARVVVTKVVGPDAVEVAPGD